MRRPVQPTDLRLPAGTVAGQLAVLRDPLRFRALAPETLFLLNPEDALQLIENATASGIELAGVEGFSISGTGAYEPRQEFSNDASDLVGRTEEFIRHTKELLFAGKKLGIRFQVVFEGE